MKYPYNNNFVFFKSIMNSIWKSGNEPNFNIFIFLLEGIWTSWDFIKSCFQTKFKIIRKSNSLFFIPNYNIFNIKQCFCNKPNSMNYLIDLKWALTSSHVYNSVFPSSKFWIRISNSLLTSSETSKFSLETLSHSCSAKIIFSALLYLDKFLISIFSILLALSMLQI